MNAGKKKCRVLKNIRQKIADANEIKYVPRKCDHKGDCQGTCPACEQEMRYIEGELHKRRRMGKAAVVVGTAIGLSALATSMSSCRSHPSGRLAGHVPDRHEVLAGDVVAPIQIDSLEQDSTIKK